MLASVLLHGGGAFTVALQAACWDLVRGMCCGTWDGFSIYETGGVDGPLRWCILMMASSTPSVQKNRMMSSAW